mmetsp:Transcript_14776/g.43794  ORF Transcript_14776/g.43794 Transcript_14776/m.43794 type:complete len:245 (-) Transcript_14776:30-764(-)
MLAGATEASMDRLSVTGFSRLRALSTHFNDTPEAASRPFDSARDGFVIAEGAAVLVLEEMESALRRGAPCIAEVTGYGLSGDAHHLTAPAEDGDGAFRAMASALRSSGLLPEDVTYVNAHATSTPLGDEIEGRAINRLFSKRRSLLVSSTKGATGHLLGAAGALEACIAALAVRDGKLPRTLNLEQPSESLGWSHVHEHSSFSTVDGHATTPVLHSMSNSFGFGGTNASLVFSKFDPTAASLLS